MEIDDKKARRLALINQKGWAVAQELQEVMASKDVSLQELGRLTQDGPRLKPEEKLRLFLAQVNHARVRLQSDDFGRCQGCSASLDEAQLDEMPWIELCHSCDGAESLPGP